MSAILKQDELFEIADVKQKPSLIDYLNENKIRYKLSKKGRVWTTLKHLEQCVDLDNDEIGDFH